MRTIRSHPSRWTENMLQRIERFRRIAAWSRTPGMRFHLRQSPVHWLQERLWLLARLEPRVAIQIHVSNPVRVAASATATMSTFIQNRTSLVWRRLDSAMTAALGAPAIRSITLKERHFAERTAMGIESPGVPPGQDATGARQAVLASSVPAPLGARLVEGPADLPSRIVRRPAVVAPRDATSARQAVLASSGVPLRARLLRRSDRLERLADVPSRIVRRPLVVAPTASPAAADTAGFASSRRWEQPGAAPAWAGRVDAPALLNVEQLTDQVLRQLDRRLIASRERTGRI